MKGDFSYFLDDLYEENPIAQNTLEDKVDVVIIGGGIGGLIADAHMREAGIKDIRIIGKCIRLWHHLVLELLPQWSL